MYPYLLQILQQKGCGGFYSVARDYHVMLNTNLSQESSNEDIANTVVNENRKIYDFLFNVMKPDINRVSNQDLYLAIVKEDTKEEVLRLRLHGLE